MEIKTINLVTKLKLREPISIEDLYDLMLKSQAVNLPGKFKLKKGLLGRSIQFDVYLNVQPTITVKDNKVTIRHIEKSSSIGGIDFKSLAQRVDGLSKGDMSTGTDYFSAVCDIIQELLKDRLT